MTNELGHLFAFVLKRFGIELRLGLAYRFCCVISKFWTVDSFVADHVMDSSISTYMYGMVWCLM